MTLLSDQAAKALYATLEAAVGTVWRAAVSSDTEMISPALRAEQILYRFRKELGDPELLKIQIRQSPTDPDHELWLIKQEGRMTDDEYILSKFGIVWCRRCKKYHKPHDHDA